MTATPDGTTSETETAAPQTDGYNYVAAAEHGTRRMLSGPDPKIMARFSKIRGILMDGTGGMEAEHADEAISRLLETGLLNVGYSDEDPGDAVLALIAHYSAIRKLLLAHYHSEINREQALLRLSESEMWAGNGRRKHEGPSRRRRTTVINYGPQYQEGSDGG